MFEGNGEVVKCDGWGLLMLLMLGAQASMSSLLALLGGYELLADDSLGSPTREARVGKPDFMLIGLLLPLTLLLDS